MVRIVAMKVGVVGGVFDKDVLVEVWALVEVGVLVCMEAV